MADSQLEPSIIVIFGITGDLAQRYLLPALYHLTKEGLLHEQTEIVGVSRRNITIDELYGQVELCVNEIDKICDPDVLAKMRDHSRMIQMDLDDPAAYKGLHQQLNNIEDDKGFCLNRLYYLSIPPQVYQPIIAYMGQAGMNTSCQHGRAATRLLVEKPFGYDLTSAEELIEQTSKVFGEEQVFRIDHFLAKETVQNILTFRSQNPVFEGLWNNQHLASIDISASEKIGIEGRAQFYEPLGAIRDFIQNHLIQLLAIVTMDQPARLDSDQLHAAKQAVLEQVQSVPPNKVAERTGRGQYQGYRDEVHNRRSVTETFASVELFVDNPRWQDVPIRLWTGKALSEKKYEITLIFRNTSPGNGNQLLMHLQPNSGISLQARPDQPAPSSELEAAVTNYKFTPDLVGRVNAYERVILDAVKGDHLLFATGEEVLQSWRIIQPVLDEWQKQAADLVFYPVGSDGQTLADKNLKS